MTEFERFTINEYAIEHIVTRLLLSSDAHRDSLIVDARLIGEHLLDGQLIVDGRC